jgi:hypothetical protein
MASNTFSNHFGPGIDTTRFTIENIAFQGRCCQGSKSKKYYKYKTLIFCEFCAKNYFEEKLPEIESGISQQVCQIGYKLEVEKKGIFNRNTQYNHGKVNVNITDPDGKAFVPVCIIPGSKGKTASINGAHLCTLPSDCYYEVGIGIGEKSPYYNSNHSFKVQMKFADGREVKILDAAGNSNILYNGKTLMFINCLENGNSNKRFFYSAPSQLERDNGLEAEHTDKSNILYITIKIYERIPYKPPSPVQYRGGGSKGVSKGGSSYKKGATFEASGESSFVKTHQTEDTFTEVHSCELTVQLMNNESEQTLVSGARAKQQDVVKHFEQIHRRSDVLGVPMGHVEQGKELF